MEEAFVWGLHSNLHFISAPHYTLDADELVQALQQLRQKVNLLVVLCEKMSVVLSERVV